MHPVATSADIDYVIDHANAVLSRPITREDIIGTWAGLRPLLQPRHQGGHELGEGLARAHRRLARRRASTVIAGGKLTTYRVMAKDAVDFAIGSRATSLPSITHDLPLVGADGLAGVPAPGPRDRPAVRLDPAAHGPPAAPVRRRCWASSSTSSTPTRRSPSRSSTPTRTSAPRSSTPRATRARCTSTTSSCTARGSTTSRPTRASGRARGDRRPRRPACSAGTRTRAAGRSRRTARGPRPRTPPRRSPTTPRP